MTDRDDPGDSPKPKPGLLASPQRDKPVRAMNIEETVALLLHREPGCEDIIFTKETETFIAKSFKLQGINGLFIARGQLTDKVLKDMKIEPTSTRLLILGSFAKILQDRGESWPPLRTDPQLPSKVFNDPIHGHIELEELLVKIIDTPVFQRLRRIKQLGCTYDVFPGASHNCFEHSLGVCYVAGEVIRTLQRECGDQFQISYKDVLCVKIAGLCHNLGRGPFANVFDDLCNNELRVSKWNFEDASVAMFDLLMEENPKLRAMLRDQRGIEDEDIERIKAMIRGDHRSVKQDDHRFLYQIVVNKKTLIDAETMDSIARDSYCVGVPTSSDYKRLVKFVRVGVPDGKEHAVLCYNDKESRDLYETLFSRVNLSQRAYQHKTGRVIELLLKESLHLADPLLQLKAVARDLIGDDRKVALAAAAKFRGLTDAITERIEHPGCCIEKLLRSEDASLWSLGYKCPCTQTQLRPEDIAGLRASQKLLKNIHSRELPKRVGTAIYDDKSSGVDTVDTAVKELKGILANGRISRTDIFVDVVTFQLGTEKKENPIESIYMYSKASKDKLFKVKRENVSSLLPQKFTEHLVRVYSRRREAGVTYEVKMKFKEFVENKEGWTYVDSTYVGQHPTSEGSEATCTGSV